MRSVRTTLSRSAARLPSKSSTSSATASEGATSRIERAKSSVSSKGRATRFGM